MVTARFKEIIGTMKHVDETEFKFQSAIPASVLACSWPMLVPGTWESNDDQLWFPVLDKVQM